ncbi:uncharacterized protein [Onthophagus taurus]|uniref:uncharacterized protein n=1 Tax=Onthophagus taurus TaxID=166361 RepID=UPI0039BE7CCB
MEMTKSLVLLSLFFTNYVLCNLNEKFTWSKLSYKPIFKQLNRFNRGVNSFLFPEDYDEEVIPSYFSNDPFVYQKNIPIGANRWKDKLFITVPRRQFGIPSTLNYIDYNSANRHNEPLIPYPELQINTLTSLPGKENFVSVYRIAVDSCDRLWMVDTGIIEVPGNRTTLKTQRLIIMDLNAEKILKIYPFPDSVLTKKTTLTMVVVDVTKQTCNDAYAYFPDLAGYGLVVYSLKKNKSWRVHHNFFNLEPTAGDLNIAGLQFQWTDGIFSIALSDVEPDGFRTAFFHSLMGNNLYKVSTKDLRDENALKRYTQNSSFKLVGNKGKNSHSSASDLHKKSGVLFFGLVNQNAVGCWNINKPFKKDNLGIVHKDDKKMIYPSDLKVVDDDLIVLTNAMPVFVYSKLNYDQINFRVWVGNVYEVIKGTPCESFKIKKCRSTSFSRLVNCATTTCTHEMFIRLSSLLSVLFLIFFVSSVESAGLNEEFSWSRISYPPETQSRFWRPDSYGGRRRPASRPGYGSNSDTLIFPDQPILSSTRPSSTTTTPRTIPVPDDPLSIEYIYENNIPMGANRWKDKLFITIPRRRSGVPSTLNYVSMQSTQRENLPVIPYPDQQTNLLNVQPGQEHLVSVYRVAVDPCDRLWMVDTGIIETLGSPTSIQPQRIVIIDLNTDKIIHTYNFKDSDLTPATVLAMTVVDVTPDKCQDAYAYFPDLAGYGLIVYSLKRNDSWRVRHNYFYLEPLAGDFNIGGIPFQWNDGVFSVALSNVKPDGFRDCIFHSMAGTNLYSVSTKILRNETAATRSYHEDDFKVLGDRGPNSQTSASDLHKPTGTLFLALVNQNAVGCYNINKPFDKRNFGIVQKNDNTMIYPSDLKIYKDDLIVLTNTMPVFLYSHLNYDQINFRVWMKNVHEAVKGTVCENS